ncbi:hypothetical protein EV356DRAFT_107550 [Viridothelium virens]|uniref:Uncharacterized protein n=1 Tax=Viridothelium virens TaxID=1048519 RepID=A0A6A6HNI6_VIRVR|nr:hypothetical protein EV356DRAFT_107550 [Viridothelium virens]
MTSVAELFKVADGIQGLIMGSRAVLIFIMIATYYLISLARAHWHQWPDLHLIRLVDDRDLKLALVSQGRLLYKGPQTIEAPLDTNGMWDFYDDLSAALPKTHQEHRAHVNPIDATVSTGEAIKKTQKNGQGSTGNLQTASTSPLLRHKSSQSQNGGKQSNGSKSAVTGAKSGERQGKGNQT